jgi:hypothetical protein
MSLATDVAKYVKEETDVSMLIEIRKEFIMKCMLAAIAAYFVVIAPAFAQQSTASPQPRVAPPSQAFLMATRDITPLNTISICTSQAVPSGYVIVGRTTVLSCGGGVDNAYVIKLPAAQEAVCNYSPLPTGYVITGRATIVSCGGGVDNAYTIKIPAAQDVICTYSPFPSGYVITGRAGVVACDVGLSAYTVKVPGASETVCKYSPIPPGYAISGGATIVSCGGGINNAYTIRRI